MNLKNSILMLLVLILAAFLLCYGEAGWSLEKDILWQLRLPKVVTALMVGGMLAVSGLLMQVFFQNPLAGPDILGISSGSSLFVALTMLLAHRLPPFLLNLSLNAMSFLGAMSVFVLLIFFINRHFSKVSLIIIGLLIASFTSSCITILVNTSALVQLKTYLLWSSGSFRNLTSSELLWFISLSICSILPVIFFQKSLNHFMLSENYAKSMGANVKFTKILFITIASLQISIVTLYCGPVGFIGIIAPHLARRFEKKAQLKSVLIPVFLFGALLAFISELTIVMVPEAGLSINSVLGLIGAPLIILFLLKQRDWML